MHFVVSFNTNVFINHYYSAMCFKNIVNVEIRFYFYTEFCTNCTQCLCQCVSHITENKVYTNTGWH